MKLFMLYDYQLPIISCFSFFFAMIGYWISLCFSKNQFFFNLAKKGIVIGNVCFFFTLFFRWAIEKYFPLSNLYESLIFLGWAISTLHLIAESKTQSRLIGSLSSPILFFLSGFATLVLPTEMQKALPLVPSLQSNWLMMHVSMMMISYALLLLGSLFSIFYLSLYYLKESSFELNNLFSKTEKSYTTEFVGISTNKITSSEKSKGKNSKLLKSLDTWSYRIIGFGFPFLTMGIISGAVWANEAWGSYWSWDPKETWALITWFVFATYLHSRLLKGWQGERASIISTIGFFAIWICYLGVNFLGKGLHSYGWVFN